MNKMVKSDLIDEMEFFLIDAFVKYIELF